MAWNTGFWWIIKKSLFSYYKKSKLKSVHNQNSVCAILIFWKQGTSYIYWGQSIHWFLPIFANEDTNIHSAMINGNSTRSNSIWNTWYPCSPCPCPSPSFSEKNENKFFSLKIDKFECILKFSNKQKCIGYHLLI